YYPALDLDGTVLLRHILRYLTWGSFPTGTHRRLAGGRGPPTPAAEPAPASRVSAQAGTPESTPCAREKVYASTSTNTKPPHDLAPRYQGAESVASAPQRPILTDQVSATSAASSPS